MIPEGFLFMVEKKHRGSIVALPSKRLLRFEGKADVIGNF